MNFIFELGFDFVNLGLSVPVGRAALNENQVFDDEAMKFVEQIERVKNKYSNSSRIITSLQGRAVSDNYNDMKFHCQAGKSSIVVSQSGNIRPCITLPESGFKKMSINEYYESVIEGRFLNFGDDLTNISNDMNAEGHKLSDIRCAGFCMVEE